MIYFWTLSKSQSNWKGKFATKLLKYFGCQISLFSFNLNEIDE